MCSRRLDCIVGGTFSDESSPNCARRRFAVSEDQSGDTRITSHERNPEDER